MNLELYRDKGWKKTRKFYIVIRNERIKVTFLFFSFLSLHFYLLLTPNPSPRSGEKLFRFGEIRKKAQLGAVSFTREKR